MPSHQFLFSVKTTYRFGPHACVYHTNLEYINERLFWLSSRKKTCSSVGFESNFFPVQSVFFLFIQFDCVYNFILYSVPKIVSDATSSRKWNFDTVLNSTVGVDLCVQRILTTDCVCVCSLHFALIVYTGIKYATCFYCITDLFLWLSTRYSRHRKQSTGFEDILT